MINLGINAAAKRAKLQELVQIERDRRLLENFVFAGEPFDFDADSQQNITGAGASAGFAIGAGALPGDLRWADPYTDFVWLDKNNSYMSMDAQTCFAFSQAAMQHKSAHIFAARALKDMDPIPDDFTDDVYWP